MKIGFAIRTYFWVGSSRRRRLDLVAALSLVGSANTVLAQVSGEQTVGIPTTTSVAPPTGVQTAPPSSAQARSKGESDDANSSKSEASQPIIAAGSAVTEPSIQAKPRARLAKSTGAGSSTVAGDPLDETRLTEDELTVSGYMPGYRRYVGFGASPYAPHTDGLPGGITPAYGAPKSVEDWTFKWSGYMNLTLQPSLYQRRNPADGQSTWVFHTPPMTIDEWSSFTSTATVPGNWVNLNFSYGNAKVTAVTSIDTWSPSEPASYYQLGSQYFINNAYLAYSPRELGGIRLRCNAGFFSIAYGGLSRYGSGIYVNPLAGLLRGAGEVLAVEYDLAKDVMLTAEHGIMTPRNGRVPSNVVPTSANGNVRPVWPASWIHHAHAGFVIRTEPRLQIQAHYIRNWAQDERIQTTVDDPVTRQLDETNIPDGSINVYAADLRLISEVYGYLASGLTFIDMKHAYPIKGLMTYGGDGESLSDRWLGLPANGTGKMLVAAANYSVSLGKIVAHPRRFAGDGPDIVINTGFHWATTWQDYAAWNRRARYKGGLDAIYTLLRYLGIGARFDAVFPNSRDMEETFYVLATRIQLKTDWTSREQLNLIYAKWFYGAHTRNEGTGERTAERLDSHLLALNFNMWW